MSNKILKTKFNKKQIKIIRIIFIIIGVILAVLAAYSKVFPFSYLLFIIPAIVGFVIYYEYSTGL